MTKQEEIREGIAALAGEYAFDKQYKDLTSHEKNSAGNWARMLMIKLHSQGVVIKDNRDPADCESCPVAVICGYVAVEPLIKEK